jgi:hypothetical protein
VLVTFDNLGHPRTPLVFTIIFFLGEDPSGIPNNLMPYVAKVCVCVFVCVWVGVGVGVGGCGCRCGCGWVCVREGFELPAAPKPPFC